MNLKYIIKESMLIGISGKLGSGKDYILHQVIIPVLEKWNNSYLHLNLADQIKVNVMTHNAISYDDVYIQKTQETRRLLQLEGTEYGRDKYGYDIWVNYFHHWKTVFEQRGIQFILCSDVRFKNEFNYFKQHNTFLVKIYAPEFNQARLLQESKGDPSIMNQIASHPSECDLDSVDDTEFNLIIHNFKGIDINTLQNEFIQAFQQFTLNT